MYRDTVTLFNYHESTGLWYPTVFSGVDFGVNTATNETTTGKTGSDAVTLLIHCTPDRQFIAADGKEKSYQAAKVYAKCSNPADCITFKTGCDFIYCGAWAWDGVESLTEEDYASGLYHEMNQKYDGVYRIYSAAFFDLLPHVEIGGR